MRKDNETNCLCRGVKGVYSFSPYIYMGRMVRSLKNDAWGFQKTLHLLHGILSRALLAGETCEGLPYTTMHKSSQITLGS